MNKTTECLAPDVPVKEIDNVFRRVLKFIDSLAEGEVVMLAKTYLSYGLWSMIVEEEAKWNFSYVMTELTDMPPSLVVPSAQARNISAPQRRQAEISYTRQYNKRYRFTPTV